MLKILKSFIFIYLTSIGLNSSAHLSNHLHTIVIDAGHGGKDRGCAGSAGAKEKYITLKIALALGKKIKDNMPDSQVLYTRMNDTFIPLNERSNIANRNKADLFISIHCNANTSTKVYGTETYAMGLHKTQDNLDVAKRENEVILQEDNYQKTYRGFEPNSPLAHIMLANFQHAYLQNSLRFAQLIERQFKQKNRSSRGVRQAGFVVLWQATMPSVLVETGFLTHSPEEFFLNSSEGQDTVASAIYTALEKYKEEIEK